MLQQSSACDESGATQEIPPRTTACNMCLESSLNFALLRVLFPGILLFDFSWIQRATLQTGRPAGWLAASSWRSSSADAHSLLSCSFAPLKPVNLCCFSFKPAFCVIHVSPQTQRRAGAREEGSQKGGREGGRKRARGRGNRFSRPGRAVGKERSCRGKAEMSQDIPL